MNTVTAPVRRANPARSPDELMMAAMQAEAQAKAVWGNSDMSAQQKVQAVSVAVAARQQSDDAERWS